MSVDTTGGKRTGRRPGKPETRERILEVAREAFIAHGYTRTSVRAIAREAGVDQALVHHYFGSKKGLILAVARMTFDPTDLVEKIADHGLVGIGPRIIATSTGIWESPAGRVMTKTLRAYPNIMLEVAGIVAEKILAIARAHPELPREDLEVRIGLLEVQMVGLMTARYVARVEPLASLSRDDVIRVVGPILQHILVGNLRPHR